MEIKKQYYAITTSMTFEKTVLVPVDTVKDINEAIDCVDCGVEIASISLLTEEADFSTKTANIADENGICLLTEEEAGCYQILNEN